MCSSRKCPNSPQRREWNFLQGGEGEVSVWPENQKKHMKFNWNFRRGGGGLRKKIASMGEVWILTETPQCGVEQWSLLGVFVGQLLTLLCYYVLWTLLESTDECQHYKKKMWKHTVKCSVVRSNLEKLLETACKLLLIIFMKLSQINVSRGAPINLISFLH